MADGTGLFDEPPRVDVPAEASTAAQRRRDRQLAAILAGQHPLTVALRVPIPLHPDAVRDDDRTAAGRVRCGGCALRRRLHGGNRSYPKCTSDAKRVTRERWQIERGPGHPRGGTHSRTTYEVVEHPRASHGDGTDVAAWWPACANYEPVEKEVDHA